MRQGPCSGSTREGSTPGVTAETSALMSAGASEKQVEQFEEGPGQERARAIGRRGAGEISLIPTSEIGVQNCLDEAGFANPASLVRMASRPIERVFRANFSLATGADFIPQGRLPGDRCPTRGQKG